MGRLEAGQVETSTLASLSLEREWWMDLRRRVGRTAGLDTHLNNEFEHSNNRMNRFLETYHQLLQGGVVITPEITTDDQPTIEIPVQGYQEFTD